MIYKLYYLDKNNNKLVRNVDDIHPYHVWQASKVWGIAIAVAEENETQPEDAADYQEATT